MDVLPSGNIFRELQDIHDTGYFSAQPSLEDHWHQVNKTLLLVCFDVFMIFWRECYPSSYNIT